MRNPQNKKKRSGSKVRRGSRGFALQGDDIDKLSQLAITKFDEEKERRRSFVWSIKDIVTRVRRAAGVEGIPEGVELEALAHAIVAAIDEMIDAGQLKGVAPRVETIIRYLKQPDDVSDIDDEIPF